MHLFTGQIINIYIFLFIFHLGNDERNKNHFMRMPYELPFFLSSTTTPCAQSIWLGEYDFNRFIRKEMVRLIFLHIWIQVEWIRSNNMTILNIHVGSSCNHNLTPQVMSFRVK